MHPCTPAPYAQNYSPHKEGSYGPPIDKRGQVGDCSGTQVSKEMIALFWTQCHGSRRYLLVLHNGMVAGLNNEMIAPGHCHGRRRMSTFLHPCLSQFYHWGALTGMITLIEDGFY